MATTDYGDKPIFELDPTQVEQYTDEEGNIRANITLTPEQADKLHEQASFIAPRTPVMSRAGKTIHFGTDQFALTRRASEL